MKRRELIGSSAALALIPFLPLQVRANTPVDMNDPAVIALKYVEEAADVERPAKMGIAGADQVCDNCRFYDKVDDELGGCALFRNGLVKGKGWCTGWVP